MLYEREIRNIDYDYIVSLNGSFIVDRDNNVLFKQSLDNQLARELVAMLKEKFGDELIISNGFDGCNTTNKKASLTDSIAREVYQRNSQIYSKTIETALDGEVLLIGCLNDNIEKAKQLRKEILLKYASQVEVFINLNYINIVPKGISKASGLDIIIKHAGIDKKFVSVIGDDLNDIPMLEKYNGYAVNNAKDEVKAIALQVYNSVSELIVAAQ
jgi:HAD superfamily hydrolase (TIGR01484 family)